MIENKQHVNVLFLGYQAARQMIEDGRQIADEVVKDAATKEKIAVLCDQLEAISNQLADMIASGQVSLTSYVI